MSELQKKLIARQKKMQTKKTTTSIVPVVEVV